MQFSLSETSNFGGIMGQVGSGATAMRGKTDLQEAALIVVIVRPELAIIGKLLIALAPFGCEEVVMKDGERER